jgi:hypothetical protein
MEKTAKNRGGGGGKLNRSETVTIRLDPKLRYLTELAARKQRRTVSSFIEWAIEDALDKIVLKEAKYNEDPRVFEITLGKRAEKLWDVDEADRVAKLGLNYPELLTHNEQVLWKLIRECDFLWWFHEMEDDPQLDFQKLREHWDAFKQVASGEADKSILPKWTERKSTPAPSKRAGEEMDFTPPLEDEDIPF